MKNRRYGCVRDSFPGGHIDFQGFVLDLDIQSACEIFKLDQKLLTGHDRPLFLVLNSFPKGDQQRGQILLLQRQQETQIPVRLNKFQNLFHQFRFCQIRHTLSPLSEKMGIQVSQTTLAAENESAHDEYRIGWNLSTAK